MSGIRMDFNQRNFDAEVKQSPIPVVVEFWAPWCGPCKLMASPLDGLAQEYDGRVKFGRVNIDDEVEITRQQAIRSVPALYLFKDGHMTAQVNGLQTMSQLTTFIANNI